MADTLTLEWEFKLEIEHRFDIATPSAPIVHDEDGTSGTLEQDSSPVSVLDSWSAHRTLSGGADSLDLTALAFEDDLAARDFTGLQVVGIKIIADSGNTEPLTFQGAVSNPYEICGDASWYWPIPPGGQKVFVAPTDISDMPVVSGSALGIAVGSAQATPGYTIVIVAGS